MFSKLKQSHFPQLLILFILAVYFLTATLTQLLHLPLVIQMLMDVAWCLLGVLILINWRSLFQSSIQVKALLAVVVLFFLSTLVGLALNYQCILYYLWGIRNNFAYLVFFFACILFLKAERIQDYWKCFDLLFAVNFLVTLFQFFILGYEQDYLGGIFGVQQGCNSRTNAFLMIVITCSIVRYLNQQEKAWVCLLKCAMALIIAALAELKMFILEFCVIIVLAVLLTKFSRRKLYLLIGGCIGGILAIQILTWIFPEWAGTFSVKGFWEIAASTNGYTGAGDGEFNRLTAIPMAWSTYLTTWQQKLFGLGLGNCDYSPYAFLTTPFYTQYGATHYTWLHSGFLMLETGLVGVVLYCGIFAAIFFAVHSLERRGTGDTVCCQTAKILALMCLLLIIYNVSLREYTAYMLFFVLALPFVSSGSGQNTTIE